MKNGLTPMLSAILCAAAIILCAQSCQEPDDSLLDDPFTEEVPEVKPSADCRLTSFTIPAVPGRLSKDIVFTINEQLHTVTASHLTWIDGDLPEMLVPSFTTTGGVVRIGGEAVISGRNAISFAEGKILSVTAENGDVHEYELRLNCPQINRELPLLRVRPDSPVDSKEVYVKAWATLSSPDTESGWWSEKDGQIEMRGRGNSTWGLPKKPYRIKFPDKFSPIGLDHAKAKSWVLLANDMDKSLIRDALGWEMSRILFNPEENYHDSRAVLFTPSVRFVNLYMHDTYAGVYLMTDQMERAKGRIEVDKLEKADGDDPEKVTGGHIIEVNIHSEPAPVRFRSGYRKIQMDHKYPDDSDYDPVQYKYIEDFIAEAEKVLYSTGFEGSSGWRRYFDERSLADYIIVKELCGDMDGYTSTYFYKRRDCDKLFFGPVWDVDKGWGNDVRGAADKAQKLMIKAGFQMPGSNGKDWFNRFWEDASFRAFVNDRWKSKRSELVAAVKAAADRYVDAMPMAVEANFLVWPYYFQACADAPLPAPSYKLEIQRIKDMTDARAKVLDGLFAK